MSFNRLQDELDSERELRQELVAKEVKSRLDFLSPPF